MRVSKIYPQVRNGAFEIDLQFLGREPADLQRGQTVQIRLTLGDPAPARLIPNGSFYNETGGAWVFVVAPGRPLARSSRQVRLGRRNNDYHRGARRARPRRARHHLSLYRLRRARSAEPQWAMKGAEIRC